MSRYNRHEKIFGKVRRTYRTNTPPDTERNPPSWIANERVWERAKAEVLPYWNRYDDPWAVVASVYRRMGGKLK